MAPSEVRSSENIEFRTLPLSLVPPVSLGYLAGYGVVSCGFEGGVVSRFWLSCLVVWLSSCC